MKLIVLNLPRNLDEKSLALLFKKIGDIKSCNLVIDKYTGISKGFGFVELARGYEGEVAINELHGSKVGKNKIRIKQLV
jgi:RNA recognition motif-containing protein|tara:strand:- start:617 stop:853 length:237 start_codon:yes stop_codon:yes gene_type:complete